MEPVPLPRPKSRRKLRLARARAPHYGADPDAGAAKGSLLLAERME